MKCILLLLLLSLLLITLPNFSVQMESGDGDTEPEDAPTLCYNPLQNISLKNELIFDNITDALQHGHCLSACLAELLQLNSTLKAFQNSFPSTNTNHIWMFTNTTDYNQCHLLQQQVLECGRGCLISHKVNYNITRCNDSCFNSCRNITDDVCYNCEKQDKCSSGCKILQMPRNAIQNNVMIPPPNLMPLIVKETDQMGIYSVNFSYLQNEEEEEGSSSIQDYSGGRNSVPNFLTLVLNITYTRNNSNEMETVIINKPTLFTVLDLRQYICREVHLSYAWINQYGSVSGTSQPIIINVKGVNISQPMAVPSLGIKKHLEYDFRQGYFGHYLINLSWINPSDLASISHYEIHVIHPPNLNFCRSAVYEVLPHFNEARTSYIIKATDPSQPPFSRCQYDLKIVSVPVHSSFHRVNTSSYVFIPAYIVDKPNLTCSHFLNSKGEFTAVIDLLISDYLALENVVESVAVIPDLIEYGPNNEVLDQDSGALVDLPIQENTRRFVYNITQNFQPKPTDNFMYEFSVTLDWVYESVYRPTVHTDKCSFNPQSPRPQTMSTPFLLQPVTRVSLSSIHIITSWEIPTQLNGFFSSYELTLTGAPLSPVDDLLKNLQTPSLEITNISQTVADWIPSFIPREDLHCMYLQIRVKNTYRSGNWSEPLTIPLDSQCINDTTPSLSPSPSQLPTITTGINGTQEITNSVNIPLTVTTTIGGVIILLVAGSVTLLCVHWLLRRRKRRMELIQEDIFRDPIFSLMGPRTIHLNDGIEIVQDNWEIPAANVIIECEIGHGEFGEVFKGMITDPSITVHTRKILKDSYSNQVAIKLLKTTATGVERKDFLNEIDLMKQISQGNNSHVVNMIGCVTSQEPLCLITEFVKYGDLLSYLRASRKLACEESTNVNPYPDLDELQSSDLLSFAYQIASGMEFLSSLDIVHRDLAARNVLVGEGKALKISDYGMSRMVEAGDTYVKTTRGKLPLKWMAIESITDREFTSASDVWAYGVTLWEIGTLGGFPYPTVNNDELLTRLKLGYRMDCPDNCSREIYDIMLECWREAPNKRPTFSELRTKFDNLLSSAQQSNAYIDLRTNEHNDIYTSPSDDEMEQENDRQEEEDDEKKRSSLRLSPSPSKKGRSPSYTSIASANSFMMTNPMFLEVERMSRRDESPRLSPRRITNPQRPTSLAMWDSAGENCYVDEPAINTGPSGIVIRVSVSTPNSPTH